MFVGVLGASNYTYAEGTWTQSLADWLGSHVRMLEYFGASPAILVPDNLKSAVSRACRYDPQLTPSYQQLAEHYQLAVVPARPYKPKDKAKAEVAVQVVERWILARLRHHTLFSLAELNQCLRALLNELNLKPFKQLPGNRREAFERLERPALRAVPRQPYQYVDIKSVKVNIDYHVHYRQHHYSVPHQYMVETLAVHATRQLVTVYYHQQAVASHVSCDHPGTTTDPAHMPKRHHKHHQWTPGRLKNWARQVGSETPKWVTMQFETRDHPEQAYRVCLGLLNLSRSYPAIRLDAACGLANRQGLRRLKQIQSILRSNLDRLPEQPVTPAALPQDHDNIRGPKSFH